MPSSPVFLFSFSGSLLRRIKDKQSFSKKQGGTLTSDLRRTRLVDIGLVPVFDTPVRKHAKFCLAAALLPPCSSQTMMACCVDLAGRGEVPMSSTLSPTQSEFSTGRWSTEPVPDDAPRLPDLKGGRFKSKRPSFGKRASRALVRFLITFGVGIAATLAWQSYGDAAREMVASSSEQLAWLAPQVAPGAQAAPRMIAPATPAASPDLEQFKAMSLGLAVVRQSVDQLAAQVAAGQEQMTRDITKLQAAEQDILHKISEPPPRPAAAPVHKPVPPTPSQASPVR
jgi:hypothetical protein